MKGRERPLTVGANVFATGGAELEWNNTVTSYPRNCSVTALFERQVLHSPDAIAITDGANQLTYCELNQRANRLAHLLLELGVVPESVVGIGLDRSVELVIAMLAVLKAAGAYLPFDTNYPPERLKFFMEDAEPRALISTGSRKNALASSGIPLILIDEDSARIGQKSQENPDLPVAAESLAYVMYTSGSTGIPKGAEIVHRGIVRLVRDTNYVDFTSDDVVGLISNPSFDAITFEVWGALLNGARLVVLPQEVILSPTRFAASILRDRITTMFLTAPLFRLMATMTPGAFGAMKTLVVGGDAVDPEAARRVLRTAPPRNLVNGYGPTEATTFSICHRIESVSDEATSIPIGRPISNSQAYILDTELNAAPIGEIGELYLAGDGLARGYLKRPELSAEKFVRNPFADDPAARMYRTGDLARYRPDGVIEFLGRADRQVKLRGFRIELGEIESVLRQHPQVLDGAVIVAGDSLAAYAVRSGTSLTSHDLRRFLASKLPDFMTPAAVYIVDTLPLTASGKLDRNALLPLPAKPHDTNKPLTEFQNLVAGTWNKICGIGQMSLDDNFFDLGGDSLQLAEIEAELCRTADSTISIVDLFKYPTVRSLANRLENGASKGDATTDARLRAAKQDQAFRRLSPIRSHQPEIAVPGAKSI